MIENPPSPPPAPEPVAVSTCQASPGQHHLQLSKMLRLTGFQLSGRSHPRGIPQARTHAWTRDRLGDNPAANYAYGSSTATPCANQPPNGQHSRAPHHGGRQSPPLALCGKKRTQQRQLLRNQPITPLKGQLQHSAHETTGQRQTPLSHNLHACSPHKTRD